MPVSQYSIVGETDTTDINFSVDIPDPLLSASASSHCFSAAQIELFETRFENGYDLTIFKNHNQMLSM